MSTKFGSTTPAPAPVQGLAANLAKEAFDHANESRPKPKEDEKVVANMSVSITLNVVKK